MWSDGYNTDVEYLHYYCVHLSPTMQRFFLLLRGIDVPPASSDDVHMELGFGQGVTMAIHAATHLGHFMGNDFHPTHTLHAQQLSDKAHLGLDVTDESFEQLARREDLPMCNSIGLHGIWNWITKENQAHILTIIKRCLKPGGVVYNSYNTNLNSAFLPLRDKMKQYYDAQAGTEIQRFDATIAYFADVFEKNPYLLSNNFKTQAKWNILFEGADKNYLLQEYFNGYWHGVSLLEMSKIMEDAKLKFVGGADFNQVLDQISVTDVAWKEMQAQPDALMCEAWRDLLLCNFFRRDLYVKGGQSLSNTQTLARLQTVRFIALKPVETWPNEMVLPTTAISFQPDLLSAIQTEFKRENYRPKTFQELMNACQNLGIQVEWLLLLRILLSYSLTGFLQICSDVCNEQMVQKAKILNEGFLTQVEKSVKPVIVAVPLTGQGMHFLYLEAWVLRLYLQDAQITQAAMAKKIWKTMQYQGFILNDVKNGSVIEDEAKALVFLEEQVAKICEQTVLWKHLRLL